MGMWMLGTRQVEGEGVRASGFTNFWSGCWGMEVTRGRPFGSLAESFGCFRV